MVKFLRIFCEFFANSLRIFCEFFVVGFLPNTSHAVHHMLLYGCPQPGSQERVWNCGGDMSGSTGDGEADTERLAMSPVCQTDEKILYAWAHNAPSLQLPEDVGFQVGGQSDIQYLVLQVHYNDMLHDFQSNFSYQPTFLIMRPLHPIIFKGRSFDFNTTSRH